MNARPAVLLLLGLLILSLACASRGNAPPAGDARGARASAFAAAVRARANGAPAAALRRPEVDAVLAVVTPASAKGMSIASSRSGRVTR
jgi:hypothetical protein